VPAALLQYIRGAAREAAGSVAVRGGTTWRGADGRHGADDTPPVVVRAAHGALCHLYAAPHQAILHVPKASGVHVCEDEWKKARMKPWPRTAWHGQWPSLCACVCVIGEPITRAGPGRERNRENLYRD
jgi:hypothetical protein